MKKVLFVTSEAIPFAKTGGLADVAGSLPRYFNKKEYDVRVIMPKYEFITQRGPWMKLRPKIHFLCQFYVNLNWRRQYAAIYTAVYEGITFYFVDNDFYFYGSELYHGIEKDIERFSFFSKAVLESLQYLDWTPEILQCNDWETGLVPVFLHTQYGDDPFYKGMKTVMTIHNLRYQGRWDIGKVMDITGLPGQIFTSEGLEFYGCANLLKGGIVYADAITTVSPTYASDMMTQEGGEGLDGVLIKRKDDFYGILNGLDSKEFNPESDLFIQAPFNETNVSSVKPKNKVYLQNLCKMPEDQEVLTIGMVTRLTKQKGLDLVEKVLDQVLATMKVQFFIIGSGDEEYEQMIIDFEKKYPDKIHTYIGYDEEHAHLIYAGCDAFLMPSLFEPCGLSQMIAMRYGTLPIVRETGGLKDTVIALGAEGEKATGFGFKDYDAEQLLEAIQKTCDTYYYSPELWIEMQVAAMECNYSWRESVKNYEDLYTSLFVYPFNDAEDDEEEWITVN